ncbi:ERF family protein [Fructilactobacillus sanfranciscensis]|uniref:ERF family protein n=1 Tax=Fructilactobacillus sanfranciscensis TaxID=1625 RepID=UPI000CD3DC11|nr:ERF family protein [Fructilactobacillus sanfranciscensis]POH18619.1 hypothetical protein BGL45_06670 [Fructilactobacillus sanfranciscensis]
MEMSNEKDKLFNALNNFRTKLKQPKKDKTNPFFKSNYVDLSGVTKAVDEALEDTGLAFFQNPVKSETPNQVGIKTIITHSSGQFIEFDPFVVPVGGKHDAQAFGSAKTYASRYSLATAFGVTDSVDDDGNSASNNSQPSRQGNYANRPRQTRTSTTTKVPTAQQLQEAKTTIAEKEAELDKLSNLTAGNTNSRVIERYGYNVDTADAEMIKKVNSFLNTEIKKQKQIQTQKGEAK